VLLLSLAAAFTLTIYAVNNTPPQITVRFTPSPGTLPDGDTVHVGDFGLRIESLPEPIPPVGYFFVGWFSEGAEVVAPVAAIANITITAAFAPLPDPDYDRYVVVVYDPSPGTMPPGETSIEAVAYGHPLTSLPVPIRAGYVFGGWAHGDTPISVPHFVHEDVELEAIWVSTQIEQHPEARLSPLTIPSLNYVIAFNPAPGFFSGDENGIRFGRPMSTISNFPTPVRSDAMFDGWVLPDGDPLGGNLVISGDIMLTATWRTPEAGEQTPRNNPQSSPLDLSFTVFSAIVAFMVAVIGMYVAIRKRINAVNRYRAGVSRYAREARIVIRSDRQP